VSGKRAPEQSQEGHRERLRQRFEKGGLAGFHDYEVIELLLTLARERGDVKPEGKEAISRFRSVRGVLDAPRDELEKIPGIKKASSFAIKLVRALAEYYYSERALQSESPLTNSREVVDYLRVKMRTLDRETFGVVYLDAQNQPTAIETLFEGTLTSSAVYPREVLKSALKHNAASLIFAHNHPSGCVEPSTNDRDITRELVLAASLMDVRVLDHIVVGADSHYSFADHGLIREYGKQAADFQESRARGSA
jgi:DNA repair protein RadC